MSRFSSNPAFTYRGGIIATILNNEVVNESFNKVSNYFKGLYNNSSILNSKNKWRTIIKDNAFIGSNSNLIAPIEIEENAYIACGSTVNHNVPEGALVIIFSTS